MPRVSGFMPNAAASAKFGLELGDELTHIGGQETADVDRIGLLAQIYGAANAEGIVSVEARRNGKTLSTEVSLRRLPTSYGAIFLGLAALLALLRGRGSRATRAFALAAVALCLLWNSSFGSPERWTVIYGYGQALLACTFTGPLILRAALLIPPSTAPRARWIFALPWVFAVQPILFASYYLGTPIPPPLGPQLYLVFVQILLVCFIGIFANNYWRAEARGRRQLRWVMFGLAVTGLPMIAGSAIVLIAPRFYAFGSWAYSLGVFLPFFILIALLRDNLFDIDRLITKTMAYVLIAALFLGLVFGIGLPASAWLSEQTGIHEGAFIGILNVLFALPVPLTIREAQPWLHNYIFRGQVETERALKSLRFDGESTEDPSSLLERMGAQLLDVVPVENMAIYAHAGKSYVPVFSAGLLVPPAMAEGGSLAELLLQSSLAIPTRVWRRWKRTGRLGGDEAAALEHMGVKVLLPIVRGDDLDAFVCLGPKLSDDVFTATELALLAGVGDRAASALERIDSQTRAAHERALYEKALGYVPSIVTEDLMHGKDVQPGEVEVTVLFIDLDGYTSRSMAQSAEATFEMINAYTKAVSAKIRSHGGAVVEFHGDGLMAVFGAPRTLASKESSALEAARESVRELKDGSMARLSLSAGVGIATGPAFVGNVEAVDRKIWSVLGNTTNLAARLRGLSSQFSSPIVIDERTYAGAAEVAHDFERKRHVQVKGRDGEFSVWCMREMA